MPARTVAAVFVAAATMSAVIAALLTLSEFSDKRFANVITVAVDERTSHLVTFHAVSLGKNTVPINKTSGSEFEFYKTYVQSVFFLVDPGLKEYRIEIRNGAERYTIDQSNVLEYARLAPQGQAFAQGGTAYELNDSVSPHRSVLPVIKTIKNWSGDTDFIVSAMKFHVNYFALTFLLFSVIAHASSRCASDNVSRGAPLKAGAAFLKRTVAFRDNKAYYVNFFIFSVSTVVFFAVILARMTFHCCL